MSVKMRQMVEREICTAVVQALLQAGYSISVANCVERFELLRSVSESAILAAMFQTDEEYLYVYLPFGETPAVAWVRFVYGSEGWDVINDYSTSLEGLVGEGSAVDAIIKKYEDED